MKVVELAGVEPASEKPTSSVLHAQSIICLANQTPTDRLRHGELDTISRFSLKRASLASLLGVTIDSQDNRRVFKAMASIKLLVRTFRRLQLQFCGFLPGQPPLGMHLGFRESRRILNQPQVATSKITSTDRHSMPNTLLQQAINLIKQRARVINNQLKELLTEL